MMGGGGGGPSEAVFEPRREEHDWTEVGARNPFSRPERRQAPGPSYADYKKKKEEPKPLSMDDESAFPSLGAGKPKAAAAPKAAGFASLAASWAAQDASEAAEQRRREQDDEEARLKREREQRTNFVPRIFRSAATQYGGAYMSEDIYEEGDVRPYSPHSPPYDPYYDEGSAAEPIRRNAMLDDRDDDIHGWQEQSR